MPPQFQDKSDFILKLATVAAAAREIRTVSTHSTPSMATQEEIPKVIPLISLIRQFPNRFLAYFLIHLLPRSIFFLKEYKNEILIPYVTNPDSYFLGLMGDPNPMEFIKKETLRIPFKSEIAPPSRWPSTFKTWPLPSISGW
jgi:hypothetical protein